MKIANRLNLVAILLIAILINGCGGRELKGEMFIVTKNRQNIPLGGADIFFVKEELAVNYFSKIVRNNQAAYDLKTENLRKQANASIARSKELLPQVQEQTQKYKALKDKLIQTALMDPECVVVFNRYGGYSLDRQDFFIKALSENPTVVTKPIILEMAQLKREAEESVNDLTERHDEMLSTINKGLENKALLDFADIFIELGKLSGVKGGEIEVFRVKTDSAGKFKISLPKGYYRGFTMQERSFGLGKNEVYGWALLIDFTKDAEIQFTNYNSGASDFYKKLKIE